MTTKLTIGRDVERDKQFILPTDVVTSTQVVYGGKGMGKTNYGAVLAEELSRAGLRWCALDPMGVWWGLRHSADGKGPGVECLILGGPHGDIPIEPTGGAVVADLVADENVNVIVDFSRKPNGEAWGVGEKVRFVRDFGKQLFKRQSSLVDGRRREPLIVIMDEAARYIPQTVFKSADRDNPEAECLSTWATITEEGRNFGIGIAFLTQRSARLNKAVAELADSMIAFRTIGPNSVAAVIDWLGEHVPKEQIKAHIERLRSLPRGTALMVSPGWLQFEGIVAVRERETFDSSATPKPGERAHKVTGAAAKPDLAKYAERMKETIERAKDSDPKELKKKIVDLERQLKNAPSVTKEVAVVDEASIRSAVERAVAQRDREHAQQLSAHQAIIEKLQNALASVGKVAARFVSVELPKEKHAPIEIELPRAPRTSRVIPRQGPAAAKKPTPVTGDGVLSGTARKMLGVLAWYPDGASRSFVAHMVGVKPTTGTFRNYLSELRTNQFMVDTGSLLKITEPGAEYLGDDIPAPPQSTDEVMDLWQSRLSGTPYKMLAHLVERNAKPISRDDLGDAVGISSSTGTFRNYMSELRVAGLIAEPDKQNVAANRETLFL
ncbi:MAG: hypothetical protein ACRD3E_09290 [Terriglobales bacterium]